MQTIEVSRFGGPDTLQLADRPDPTPAPGQVLVQVHAAGVNFADVMARAGHYPGVPSAPFSPGLEVAGVVTALGAGVESSQVGDRVMALVAAGGYSSHHVLDARQVIPLPAGIDFGVATALLVQGLTAFFLLEEGRFGAGQTVLIPGAAGGLGSLAVQMARLMGAGQVIGLASPDKHERVRDLGAHTVLNYRTPGWSTAVREATGGRGVDVFLDSQGDLAGEGFDTLAPGARWLIFGSQAGSQAGLPGERGRVIIGKNLTLRGYMLQSSMPHVPRAIAQLLGWLAAGQLRVDTECYPLAEASRAHTDIEARKTVGKVVLTP